MPRPSKRRHGISGFQGGIFAPPARQNLPCRARSGICLCLARPLLYYCAEMNSAGKTMRLLLCISLSFLLAPFWALPSFGQIADDRQLAKQMAPHKALYEIKMTSKSSGSQILNISGQMFYEWHPECEAWVTDHRFNLLYEYADSPAVRIASDFSTYEPFDGKSFDFTSRRKRNGSLYQEIRGRAEKGADGAGKAVYSLPEGLSFDLDRATLFPMAHSLEILRQAQGGEKFYRAIIFDGSDEEGPVEISAFLGKTATPLQTLSFPSSVDASLLKTKAWNVRMAFFPLSGETEDSDYEMDAIFHNNGIISDMNVEYKDFSITQKLVALEKLTPADCAGTENQGKIDRTGHPAPEQNKGSAGSK